MSHADVKPITHWAIAKAYTLRFTERTPTRVRGVFKMPDGAVAFSYDPRARTIVFEDGRAPITINEYGWEVDAP